VTTQPEPEPTTFEDFMKLRAAVTRSEIDQVQRTDAEILRAENDALRQQLHDVSGGTASLSDTGVLMTRLNALADLVLSTAERSVFEKLFMFRIREQLTEAVAEVSSAVNQATLLQGVPTNNGTPAGFKLQGLPPNGSVTDLGARRPRSD
jgi:hypothetical protein